ncbi:hypothetical protein [Halomonas sp. MMSF_3323]|uniref:hypothetical protein n=1 Tax=Halomonas sp. MMSF_3323 TaxID=3046701 RepID=UPI00273DBCA7|nr:hypothetical protein [Halomonas sp. MMSF_3323]
MRIWDINPTDHTVIDPAGRDCPIDPMSGQPKVPGSAIVEPPPSVAAREAAQAVNGDWRIVPDWRGHVYWLSDGTRHEIIELGVEPPAEALNEAPPRPIDDLAAQALSRINSGYQAEMGQILNDYPQAETLTFDKQEREARQWQAENSVATPYIDAMLVERPMDKAELVGRILAKADAFTMASGKATGKRQRLEDEVKAAFEAEDRDALETLSW